MIVVFLAAIIPLLVGFIWYNPKVFGNAWMAATGMTPEDGKKANMPLIFGLTFLFGFMMAFFLGSIVFHQNGLASLMIEPVSSKYTKLTPEQLDLGKQFAAASGHLFRSFGHGAFHSLILGIFLILPVIAINAMFERRSWKYILINVGYFIVTLSLMGGVICAWGKTALEMM